MAGSDSSSGLSLGGAGVAQNPDHYPRISLQTLPFYHARPVVPIPPGTEPLPAFHHARPPRFPSPMVDMRARRAWYMCTAGINPGLRWTTWDDFRPNVEAHWGFPAPYGPVFRRIDGQLPSVLTSVAVLAPPPRPDVELGGTHRWTVYVGRVPGVYYSLYVSIDSILLLSRLSTFADTGVMCVLKRTV